MRATVLAVITLVAVASCSNRQGEPPLTRAECETHARRQLGGSLDGEPEVAAAVGNELVMRCLAGDTDRQEYECVEAAGGDELRTVRCVDDGRKRRDARAR